VDHVVVFWSVLAVAVLVAVAVALALALLTAHGGEDDARPV
jgi:hypothetical protein